ncbi:MAG TPA: glutamate racemase [Nevskiaceae bacterium]|nr:glutamate racemase [Nevskiaceae bacterium]
MFDSGAGGLSVVHAIKKILPEYEVLCVDDQEHLPYGDKSPEELLRLVTPILKDMQRQGCVVIVIACNTVTTTIIKELRKRIDIPLVGMEPMVKPAAAVTKTGVIAVCATPATLASTRYAWLKATYAKDVKVLEPDCSQWAYMIEHDQVNEAKIKTQIDEVCDSGADVIVLGCTHYHWIEKTIQHLARKRAVVVQPEQPVIAQLKRVLARQP